MTVSQRHIVCERVLYGGGFLVLWLYSRVVKIYWVIIYSRIPLDYTLPVIHFYLGNPKHCNGVCFVALAMVYSLNVFFCTHVRGFESILHASAGNIIRGRQSAVLIYLVYAQI